jgi:hypothetical protein
LRQQLLPADLLRSRLLRAARLRAGLLRADKLLQFLRQLLQEEALQLLGQPVQEAQGLRRLRFELLWLELLRWLRRRCSG